LIPGLVFLAAGVALGWPDITGRLHLRLIYGGAFMPPGLDYIAASIGLMLVLIWLLDRGPRARWLRPVRTLGRAALFVYVVHNPLIWILDRFLSDLGHWTFIGLYLVSVPVLAAIAEAWARLRPHRRA
jgi:hypothetical protein